MPSREVLFPFLPVARGGQSLRADFVPQLLCGVVCVLWAEAAAVEWWVPLAALACAASLPPLPSPRSTPACAALVGVFQLVRPLCVP